MKGIEEMLFSMLGVDKTQVEEVAKNFGEQVQLAQTMLTALVRKIEQIEKNQYLLMSMIEDLKGWEDDRHNSCNIAGTIIDGSAERIG